VKEGGLAVAGNTSGGGESIDEKVIVITGDFPHGESEQVVLDDEFSLGSEGLWVVVGNHQLLGLVVKEGSLTTLVERRLDSAGRCSIIVEESLADQFGKIHDIRLGFRVSTLIDAAGSRVLGESRVGGQISRAANSIGWRNGE